MSYLKFTGGLIGAKRTYGSLHTFGSDLYMDGEIEEMYNAVFAGKTAYKDNIEMGWGTWLIDCVFPRYLYTRHSCSLKEMLIDDKLWWAPTFSERSSCHSHFGRMARPREVPGSKYIGFLDYLLDRWSRGNHRSMPHFYFDIESPGWIFGELMRNPNQIKTGRTATSCVTNFSFRWNPIDKIPVMTMIVKHTQWHHSFGDFFGAVYMLRAIARELGLDPFKGLVNLFFVSASLDHTKEAKDIYNSSEGLIYGNKQRQDNMHRFRRYDSSLRPVERQG